MAEKTVTILCITFVCSLGCGSADPRVSRSHVARDRGQTAPKATRVAEAPPNVPEPAEITEDEFVLPDQLPDLLIAYRLKLIENLPVISAELAEQYADTEIADLKRRYSGQEDALRRELGRRLREAQPTYGAPAHVSSAKTLYPDDPRSRQ